MAPKHKNDMKKDQIASLKGSETVICYMWEKCDINVTSIPMCVVTIVSAENPLFIDVVYILIMFIEN